MGHKILINTLSHSFNKRSILSNLNFECNTGEIVGILGRNGTGKSTFYNILFGTLKADIAEIYFDNRLVKYGEGVSNFVGYHTQDIMLPKYTKARDIISMYLPLNKQDNVFYSPGIHEMTNKRVSELSLGQQRYLQLLLLLNLDHPFLIIDEPFSMVEPLYKSLIKKTLLEYREHKGILITDHYYLDILEIADRVNLMKDGKLVPIIESADLITQGYLSEQSVLY